ncbi:MAG: hybrid sensor histidine kinase/response regulator [Syntrophales bacterium]|nr:hybrid sensor histidine kinase/response regulator [Syntrophales bacterium]
MNTSEDIKRELLTAFQSELRDLLGVLNRGLLSLEKGPAGEERERLLADLFRAAHSIKGGARAVQIRDIEKIAHRLEDVMGMIRRGELPVRPEIFDILFRSADALKEAMDAYLTGNELPRDHREKLLTDLEEIKKGTVADGETALPAKPPRAASPPVAPSDSPQGRSSTTSLGASAPGSSPPPARMPTPVPAAETIRVATAKVDNLMDRMGELMVARMRTEQRLNEIRSIGQRVNRWQKEWSKVRADCRRLKRQDGRRPEVNRLIDFLDANGGILKTFGTEIQALHRQFASDYRYLVLLTDDMHDVVRRVRMLPTATLFELIPRMVRDLAREQGKEINLQMEGADTEVDRQLLDMMKDPLTHLLRNAVDHGIERPDDREAAGKPRLGTIRLRAAQKGNTIVLTVSDDGAGIDLNAVRQAALERGLLTSQEIEGMKDCEILDLIYHSGLSTHRKVTEISGRGIGLDVVRKNLERLQGMVDVETVMGNGTAFTLTLPLTLATSHVLLMRVAGQIVSIPTTTVVRILKAKVEEIGSIEGKPAIRVSGSPLSLFPLARVLELSGSEAPFTAGQKIPIVVVGIAEKKMAFRIDDLYGTQEVVIKGMGRQFSRVRNVAGAAILGDGQVVMILNVADLVKSAQKGAGIAASIPVQVKEAARRRLLVVDDSITTRTLEKNILENAGYQVIVAADGDEAWAILQSESVDGIVADISMPCMDGFVLTRKIRGHEKLKDRPVVLVTSLETPQDKIRGMEAGADAYIIKGTFDQRVLLATVERLIG